MKEEFFSKFIDYNNKLEKILETKDFSLDVKNLLLSMLYKIDISYSDYQTVKRNVKNKQEFFEDVLRIIENCKNIELIKPNSEQAIEFEKQGIKFKVDQIKYEIQTIENETVILEALLELDNEMFYLPEKYNLIRIAFNEMLNKGKVTSNVEVIRDFNAWSWNILTSEINNFYANIIYQNLEYLIGKDELEDCINDEEIKDKIKWIEENLEENNFKKGKEFLKLIFQISIACCVNNSKAEKARLLDEKEFLQEEYEKMLDKEKYLENITKRKKENAREIEKIDRILNDKELLRQEYISRNQKLSEYNKLWDINHLIEILNKQREKAVKAIKQGNELIKPYKYLENINKLEEQIELLSDVEKNQVNQKAIEDKMISLEEMFLEYINKKIKDVSKKEIIELVYIIRYYNNIPFDRNKSLNQIEQLNEILNQIEELIINKMQELKIINKISEDKKFNFKILRNIFDTKIINLENIHIQIKKVDEKYKLELYDKEVLEKEILLLTDEKEIKELKIRTKKMIKLFV